MTKAVLFSSNNGDINADLAFKNNFTATSVPGTGDDADDGYTIGSVWINLSTDIAYMCVDATAGAAVWSLLGESGIDPTELALLNGAAAGTVVAGKAVAYGSDGLVYLLSGAIVAAGADAATATVLSNQVNAVTAADGAKGVALPAAAINKPVIVINTVGTLGLLVYPVSGGNDNINGLAEDLPVTVGPGQIAVFVPTSATQWYVSAASLLTATPAAINLLIQGVAAGYKIARGVRTQVAASDTVVTGLATVVAAIAQFQSPPTVKQLFVAADIGNQSGAPAAGSILIKTYKPTAVNDVTPAPATDFTDNLAIAWVAIGT